MADKIVVEAEVKSNIGEVSKDASNAAGEFKIMGLSLNGVKAGFISAGTSAKAMFASIKAGLISTGIGAFLVAIGSLVSYFTNTKRGADKLERAMAGLGAVVDALTDAFSELGGIILDTFQDPMPALKNFGNGLLKLLRDPTGATRDMFIKAAIAASDFKDELVEETAAMMALKKRTQELRDAENEFMIQKAKTRKEIEKARLIAEDETKSAEDRLENLKKALELEEKTTNRELALARERMEIQKQEMALSENLVEDERKLAELKTEIIERETASIKMRRRVVTEVNALEREIQAEEKARAKEKQDIIDAEWADKIKANDEWNKEQDRLFKKEIALAKKAAEEKIKLEKAVKDAKVGMAQQGLRLVGALAGEGTDLAKGAAIAQATISGIEGVQNAYTTAQKSPYTLAFPGYPIVQAGLAAAFSALQIQKISSTSTSGGGGGGAGGGGGGGASAPPAPQMMSGAFELTGGVEPEPTRAYVVTDEMTSSQNQLANIRRRATI